jgi:superfamily II DNA or RNA helicase
VVIATSILDEGINVDNINAIIYARGMKSSRKILQGIGRGLRKKKDDSCLAFYDFLDYTNSYLTEHTLNRYEVMKNEGFDIIKLELGE